MKRTLVYLLGVCLVAAFMALTDKQKPVIYMIGDSTMSNKPIAGGNPERGLGSCIARILFARNKNRQPRRERPQLTQFHEPLECRI